MSLAEAKGVWASGGDYEPYMGRWSRMVATDFIRWLDAPQERQWLDVGCGTGALSQIILKAGFPKEVVGIDLSRNYIEYARRHVIDKRVSFRLGDAQTLSSGSDSYDVVVSGLTLNFIAEPRRAVMEMAEVTRAGGIVAAYVWDYADKMQLLRYFWDAALTLHPEVRDMDEGQRSPICHPTSLASLFSESGIKNIECLPIDVDAHFPTYDDYWLPFLGGQGTVASYVMSLGEKHRSELQECIRARLPIGADGSIRMSLRAWAVKGNH